MRNLFLFLFIISTAFVYSQTYHIDAENGSDISGDGSMENPYQSLDAVWENLGGGEQIILYNGNYGSILENYYGDNIEVTDWITIQAASGYSPSIDSIYYIGFASAEDLGGTHDAFLHINGVNILNGINLRGVKNITFENCVIERNPPWHGSVENIEKTAISFRNVSDVVISDCEITRTGTAIAGGGNNIQILNNHIHLITHDGIRVNGMRNSLIEGNEIHNLDDGVSDNEADWSRHCDAIHIFIPGSSQAENLIYNDGVIIRGNKIYDIEAQGVQFNNYYQFPNIHNRNIIFENNIFGPTRANVFNQADICDNLIFRNNTIVYLPEGHTFTSHFRDITCTNHTFRVTTSENMQIYNNILVNAPANLPDATIYEYNIIQNPHPSSAYGRFTIIDTSIQFVNPAALDGILLPGSQAVNAGTRLFAPTEVFDNDFYGTGRDNRPDIGAYELPGENPEEEIGPATFNDDKYIFIDDFEDADLFEDDWLQGENIQGLSWFQYDSDTAYYNIQLNSEFDGNYLASPVPGKTAKIFSGQGANWKDYTLEFDAFNGYRTTGDGPVVLALNDKNFYWFDISRDNGRFIRYMTNAEGIQSVVQLAESESIEMPHQGLQTYSIKIEHTGAGINFVVDVNRDGSSELAFTDTDENAVSKFISGGIGFFLDYLEGYSRIGYDNIKVTVDEFSKITDENSTEPEIKDFKLQQNYPNPFNPTTIIEYTIPVGGQESKNEEARGIVPVQLMVYNILGQEIVVLVDETQPPGKYQVKFDASSVRGGLPSGVYIISLKAGNHIKNIKALLLK